MATKLDIDSIPGFMYLMHIVREKQENQSLSDKELENKISQHQSYDKNGLSIKQIGRVFKLEEILGADRIDFERNMSPFSAQTLNFICSYATGKPSFKNFLVDRKSLIDNYYTKHGPSRENFMKILEILGITYPNPGSLMQYLDWLLIKYDRIELPFLGSENKRIPTIPLDKVYVGLKVESKLTDYERECAFRNFEREMERRIEELEHYPSQEEVLNIRNEILQNNPKMAALVYEEKKGVYKKLKDPDTFDQTAKVITLAEAFREQRYLVILGDPGSGKSTLSKWLILKLAKAMVTFLDYGTPDRVFIDNNQVDFHESPDAENETTDIGMIRLPILVKISEYAKKYASSPLPLVEFLGFEHSLQGIVDQSEINKIMKDYLKKGEAVVILDGVDEISFKRNEILLEIQSFIQECIKGSTSEKNDVKLFEPPYKSGGNQVIITSRIVGYHSAPLSGNLTHVTIQKMEEIAVRHFCDIWMKHVHLFLVNDKIKSGDIDKETVLQNAKLEATTLKNVIYNSESDQVKDLASNPLLITILAVIFREERGQLPKQRAVLYEKATDILINKLRPNVSVNKSELDYILCGLALDIHKSVGDDITKAAFESSVKRHLENIRKERNETTSMSNIDTDTKQLIDTISTDVGLLAESTTHVYRFLHRTFQEYLTGKFLIIQPENAADNILKRISDPMWRVPILLAIGHIDKEWDLQKATVVIEKLLTADDPLKEFIPRGALLIADTIVDLENISDNNINKLVRSLLELYIKNIKEIKIKSQRERLEKAFTTLITGPKKELVFNGIEEQLTNKNQTLYIAKLLYDKGWFTITAGRILLESLELDSEVLGFPIHGCLQAYLSNPEKTTSQINAYTNILGFKNYLLSNPKAVSIIKKNIVWQRLIVMLYGGISNMGIAKKARQFDLFQKQIDQNQGSDDELHNIAVKLDTEGGEIARKLQQEPEFNPRFIYKDSPFTKKIRTTLENNDACTQLQSFFIDSWEGSDKAHRKAQSLLALVAIGYNVDTILREHHTNEISKNAIFIFLKELKRIKLSLRDPIYRSKEILKKYIVKSTTPTFFDQFPKDKRAYVLKKSIQILIDNGVNRFDTCYTIKEKRVATLNQSDDIIYAEAEGWVSRLSNINDSVYNMAVLLDTTARELTNPIKLFILSLINIHKSKNIQSKEFVDWQVHLLPYKPKTLKEQLLLALSNISEIPDRFDFVKDWMIWSLRSLLKKCPEIIPEALVRGVAIKGHDLIKSLKPELFDNPNTGEQLLAFISEITDPYTRFRALWQLVQLYYKNEWEQYVIKTYYEIQNPLHLVEATEMILISTNDKILYGISVTKNRDITITNVYPQMWKTCRDKINNIPDIENKIRAKCRLAVLYYQGVDHTLIDEAFALIQRMKAEDKIKEGLINEIRAFLKSEELEYEENQKAISNTIKNSWYKNTIEEKNHKNLVSLDENINVYKEIWTCLSVYSICEDYVKIHAANTENKYWHRLGDTEQQYQALKEIIKTGKNGILLTIEKFMILDKLMDTGFESIAIALFPYLEKPESSVFTLIRKWSGSENKHKKLFSSLLLAENNEITSTILTDLLQLFDTTNDRLRVRASVAIHGVYTSSDKIDRSKKLSEIGLEVLKEIVRKEKCYWDNQLPANGIRLQWFFSDLIMDDPYTLQQMLKGIKANKKDKNVLLNILKNTEYITPDVWSVIKKHFSNKDEQIRKSLFKSLCAMICLGQKHRTHLPPEAFEELSDVIKKIPPGDWEHHHYFLYEEKIITESIREAYQQHPDQLDNAIKYAEELVKERSEINLNGITKLENYQIQKKLGLVGDSLYVRTGKVISKSKEAIKIIKDDDPDIFNLLVNWCIRRLQSDLFEEHPKKLGAMLCILTSVCADIRPEQIKDILRSMEDAEGLLIEIVKKHPQWVARRGAIALLGSLGNLSEKVIHAIVSALKDVPFVQEGVFQSFTSFKTVINKRNINELEKCLNSNSGLVAMQASKILGDIMVSNQYSGELREKVIEILTNKLNEQRKEMSIPKHVFYLDRQQSSRAKIVNGGVLDHILYEELIKISGIN